MINLLSFTSRPIAFLVFQLLGLCLLITGLITAARDVSLVGITPAIWMLLVFGSFIGAIGNTLFVIQNHLERQNQGK
ncbi:MAG: hypothetical protein WAV05_16660 [Anaerolineales bacterium]